MRLELVARAKGAVHATALKALRELSSAVSALTPVQVVDALHSQGGLSLGVHPLYRADEMSEQLSSLGILLERVEHEG
jgi:hypothetical protein